jgi:hypothetical protein
LLQGWLTLEQWSFYRYCAFVWAGRSSLGFCLLTSTLLILLGSGSGLDIINSSPAAIPARWQ